VKNDNSQKETLIPFLKSNIVSVIDGKIIVRWKSEI
jgi:ribosomal 30S subunit maturation factor RimM